MKIQIAILGGAFDPITLGHLKMTQFVLDSCPDIDEVWVTPCYRHRYDKKMASAADRIAMIKIAIDGVYRVNCFDYEIRWGLEGSTKEFLDLVKKDLGNSFDFHIIIGLDNANDFHKWVCYDYLIKETPFIVVPRKGVARNISTSWYEEKPHVLLSSVNDIPEISSTQIRESLKKNRQEKPEGLDERVYEYILANNLYLDA
jgi:nicotinate-nucleotide adenylyltransferase